MDFSSDQAIYLQIADLVCENILRRRWIEGDKIPSVRELAVNIEVNPNTVMRTYTYLEEKGIIEIQRGIGFFIPIGAYEKTLHVMREDFIKNHLPRMANKMDLLKISMQELQAMFSANGSRLKGPGK